jgi:hypothetical protein
MAERNFVVTGVQKFRGNPPGSTFKADPDDPQIERAIATGSISAGGSSKMLEDQSREELNELASRAGVERPADLEDKAAVVKAIRAKERES